MAIDIQKFIQRFIQESREHIQDFNHGLAQLQLGTNDGDLINSLFRIAHTMKGSSRMLKLSPITATAHALEDILVAIREQQIDYDDALGGLMYRATDKLTELLDILQNQGVADLPADDQDLNQALMAAAQGHTYEAKPQAKPAAPLEQPQLKTTDTVRLPVDKIDELVRLMGEVISTHVSHHHRLLEIKNIERKLADKIPPECLVEIQTHARKLKDDLQQQDRLMVELHDNMLLMRMLPLAVVFDPVNKLVRDLAASVGKQVKCHISGAQIELDRQIIDKLSEPLVHLVRNAIDHGLETPEQRQAQNKPAYGVLTLNAYQDSNWVLIEIIDDGAGIPVTQIRNKAVRKGLLSQEKVDSLTDDEAIDLIFMPGFSTSEIISDISGRGVGMDVVKRTLMDDLQGTISIKTEIGQGSKFTLRLPLSLAIMRILIVSVRSYQFAFTAQYISELIRVNPDQYLNIGNRDAVIIRNEFVPVFSLDELFTIPQGGTVQNVLSQTETLLVLQINLEKIAIKIDRIIDERDMVIKPLPAHMHNNSLVAGAVVGGNSELICVLQAPGLLEKSQNIRGQAIQTQAQAASSKQEFKILVVDDSLNTREIEKDVLEAYGYQVTLAQDGVDGLAKARQEQFDAVLTDVEMPNMDGFSLTENLRADENYAYIPIIIITSREKEEDKRRGIQVGADAYIVKGDFDQNNLVDTLRTLLV